MAVGWVYTCGFAGVKIKTIGAIGLVPEHALVTPAHWSHIQPAKGN